MPRTAPFHSKTEHEKRHHTNTKCGPGSEIPPHNREQGTGGFPECEICKDLNKKGE